MRCQPSPRVVGIWRLYLLLLGLTITGLIGIALWRFAAPLAVPTVTGCFLVTVLTILIYPPLRRRSLAYHLTPQAVYITGGILWRTRRVMPVSAVRQVTLMQGIPERLTGIACLAVNGLGGRLLLEGLDMEQATALYRQLSGHE